MVGATARIRLADRRRRHDRRGLPRALTLRLRPLPRSQVRPDHPARLLRHAGDLRRQRPALSRARSGSNRIKALNGLLSDAPVPKALLDDPRCTVMDGESAGFRLFHRREPLVVHRLHRGELNKPQEVVEPALPGRLADAVDGPGRDFAAVAARPNAAPVLARWLTSPENPLVARVLVNRVWGWHFGRAIVRTPNDFGAQGEEPTHPELLDWLACELSWITAGASSTCTGRSCCSDTYRMASTPWRLRGGRGPGEPAGSGISPAVAWRERQIRDAMLACSGQLNPGQFGAPVVPPLGAGRADRPVRRQGEVAGHQGCRRAHAPERLPAGAADFHLPDVRGLRPARGDDELRAAAADDRADPGLGPAEQPAGPASSRPPSPGGLIAEHGRRHREGRRPRLAAGLRPADHGEEATRTREFLEARTAAPGGAVRRRWPSSALHCSTPTSSFSSTDLGSRSRWTVPVVMLTSRGAPPLISRREVLAQAGLGFGAWALLDLLEARPAWSPRELAPRPPHFPARAKHVIFLFMQGGPSHIDTFDPKPLLRTRHGRAAAAERHAGLQLQFTKTGRGRPRLAPDRSRSAVDRDSRSPTPIRTCRPAPTDLAIVRSCHHESFNHAPAQYMLNTGHARMGRPCLGSWVTYGLGSESENLPAFVVMATTGDVKGGPPVYGQGFLPGTYQPTVLRNAGSPVLYLEPPPRSSARATPRAARHGAMAQPASTWRRGAARADDLSPRIASLRAGVPHAGAPCPRRWTCARETAATRGSTGWTTRSPGGSPPTA